MGMSLKSVLTLGFATSISLIGQFTFLITPSLARNSSSYCHNYADEQARRQTGGMISGGAVGAGTGALIGGVFGGGRGASRGAQTGAIVGGINGHHRQQQERDRIYWRAYDDCMRRNSRNN
jgi:uncharacterized protein YcfJ